VLPLLPIGTKERPDAQCDSLMRYLLHESTWLPQDRLAACENIDATYFQNRVAGVLQFGNVLTYAHGDCSDATTSHCHDAVVQNINATHANGSARGQLVGDPLMRSPPIERSRVLSPASHTSVALPAFNAEDPNSALLTFFQV
jgi:hypothetical protein